MPSKRYRLVLLLCSIVLGVGIYFLPKHKGTKPSAEPTAQTNESAKAPAKDKFEEAVALVSEGKEPMKGIMMLRELLEENPNNDKVHFQLGLFSIQSGQSEKALDRFVKVIEINPNNWDAVYYKALSLDQLGRSQEAKVDYEKYLANGDDETLKTNALKRINEIKN